MVTVQDGDFTVESNTGDADAIRAQFEVNDGRSADDQSAASGDASTDTGDAADRGGDDGASAVGSESSDLVEPAKPERKAKPRDNPQARISQLTAQREAAERRAADLEARLAALEQRATSSAAPPEKPSASAPSAAVTGTGGRPKPSQDQIGTVYPDWDAYQEDLTDWKVEQRLEKERQDLDRRVAGLLAQREEAAQWQQIAAAHQERIQALIEAKPDFEQHRDATSQLMQAQNAPFTDGMIRAIVSSPKSADVLDWLARHPQECIQLARKTASFDAAAASVVVEQLEARVSAGVSSGAASAPPVSRAKAPTKPVGASPSVALDDGSDEESVEAHIARENARDRKRGRL